MQNVAVCAAAAGLLPKAFPQLASLVLKECPQHTAALLQALRSCQHLTHIAIEEPKEEDPAALWAAAVAEAAAGGHLELLQSAAVVPHDKKDWGSDIRSEEEKEVRCQSAAATGYLLGQLPHVTSVKLAMYRMLPALRLMVLHGLGARLQKLTFFDLLDHPHSQGDIANLLAPALQACSCLASLDAGGGDFHDRGLAIALASCPALATSLRSLSLPSQGVAQELLDGILQHLPGGGAGHACR